MSLLRRPGRREPEPAKPTGVLRPGRPREAAALGDLLAGFMQTSPVGRELARETIEARWREAVGAEVAAMTEVRGYRDRVLTIVVGSSALLQELSTFYRSSILATLREKPGQPVADVREISFKLGAIKKT